jgi:hypothetical protein
MSTHCAAVAKASALPVLELDVRVAGTVSTNYLISIRYILNQKGMLGLYDEAGRGTTARVPQNTKIRYQADSNRNNIRKSVPSIGIAQKLSI